VTRHAYKPVSPPLTIDVTFVPPHLLWYCHTDGQAELRLGGSALSDTPKPTLTAPAPGGGGVGGTPHEEHHHNSTENSMESASHAGQRLFSTGCGCEWFDHCYSPQQTVNATLQALTAGPVWGEYVGVPGGPLL
jgi:hypothetical protein